MVREIEAGNVSTVIVKDMSRFGRNYLQVGFYTEIMFPDKGVRFIAVNNSIDSAKPQENDFTPFLNIMNEFYSRDTSNKIKAIFRARMQDGKRCSGSVPYGYVRSPSDKQTLVVDPEAAQVVRQIFDLACQGMGAAKIADFLCESQVLIPSAYQRLHHPENCRHNYRNPYRWSGNTVNTILSRREYLGETILGKSVCENFKTKKRRAATPEEQLVFPNTHEAIIDQETWDTAQQMRKRAPRRRPNGSDSHRLSGLVYCADCGARLSYHDCTTSRCRDRPMTPTWAFSAATTETFTTRLSVPLSCREWRRKRKPSGRNRSSSGQSDAAPPSSAAPSGERSGWQPCGRRPRQMQQLPPSTKPTGCNTAPTARTIGSAAGRGKEQRYVRAAIRTIWENASPVLKAG